MPQSKEQCTELCESVERRLKCGDCRRIWLQRVRKWQRTVLVGKPIRRGLAQVQAEGVLSEAVRLRLMQVLGY